MEPRALADRAERDLPPPGEEERFAGYGVMGLPFASGHVLGLRRFPASSVGPGYTSVWHRDPGGRWRFYQNVPAAQACPRYFGSAVAETVEREIDVTWTGPRSLSVSIPGERGVDWQVEVAPTWQTRVMNASARLLPEAAWHSGAVLRAMGAIASILLRAGHLGLVGHVPNGQAFIAAPRRIWFISSSRAVVAGEDVGSPGPLGEQARLGDFWIPQRGILAFGGALFEPLDTARHATVTSTSTPG